MSFYQSIFSPYAENIYTKVTFQGLSENVPNWAEFSFNKKPSFLHPNTATNTVVRLVLCPRPFSPPVLGWLLGCDMVIIV